MRDEVTNHPGHAFVFVDVASSTALATTRGKQYPDVLAAVRSCMVTHLERCGATLIDAIGDELFCFFDDTSVAVHALVALGPALTRLDVGQAINFRAAIHLAHVPYHPVVGYSSYEIHRAHRILGAADDNQVLLSTSAVTAIETLPDGWRVVDHGLRALRGLTSAERVFELCTQSDVPRHPRARLAEGAPLPARAVALVGRDRELRQLEQAVAQHQLVTVVGQGGVGKTRLVVELLSSPELEVRPIFCDLSELREATPDAVARELLGQLGIQERIDVPPVRRLIDALASEPTTLVIDNFEQLLDASGLVAELVASAPTTRIVVTSRAALGLRAERVHVLDPLPISDAAVLYRCLLELSGSDERTHYDLARHEQICTLLDGLPLAIELAAARSAVLGTATVLRHLDEAVGLLSHVAPDRPARHYSLDAVLAWSIGLLTESERRVLLCVSLLPAGATLATLAQVSETEIERLLDALGQLIRFHLVRRQQAGTDDRFVMLRLIRIFAERALNADYGGASRRVRIAAVYSGWARRAAGNLAGATQLATIDEIDSELDNVRMIISWCRNDEEIRPDAAGILSALVMYFWHRNAEEAFAWHVELLSLQGVGRREALLSVRAALLAKFVGEERQPELARRAIDLALNQGDNSGVLLEATLLLANADLSGGEATAAREGAETAEQMCRSFGGAFLGVSLTNVGDIYMGLGETDEADKLFEEASAVFERAGEAYLRATPLVRLGELAFWRGDAVSGLALIEDAYAMQLRIGTRRTMPRTLAALARGLRQTGDLAGASDLLRDALRHVHEDRSWREFVWPVFSAALVAEDLGRSDEARELLVAARQLSARFAVPIDSWLRREAAHLESANRPAGAPGSGSLEDLYLRANSALG